jgi:ABC-2 type transport system permease protein
MYFNVTSQEGGGETSFPVFPAAVVSYSSHGQQLDRPVNFFKGSSSNRINDETINRAVENLEYEFISAMRVITRDRVPSIAIIEGHGELEKSEIASLTAALEGFYQVKRVAIEGQLSALDEYDAIIVADPKERFSEKDKFIIDQFILKGGKSMWLVDASKVDLNQIAFESETMSEGNPVVIGGMLFSYGARINSVFVQDIQCAVIPVDVSSVDSEEPEWSLVPYVYFPLAVPRQDNPITRNLNLIRFEFASSVDTVGDDPNIKKTVLLNSSKNSRYVRQPVRISTDIFSERLEASRFPKEDLPLAVLLEGKFQSFYKSRLHEDFTESELVNVLDESITPTKMIVIGDGEVAKNNVLREGDQQRIQEVGFDRFSGRTFGNKDFLLNCMNYLLDDEGVMGVRSREVRLRLMDYDQITEYKAKWQLINLLIPVALVIIFGLVYVAVRRRKYAKK